MHKKWVNSLLIVFLTVITILFVYYLVPKKQNENNKNSLAKTSSPIDVRPLIIEKLQSLVKEGSDSLYDLTIEDLEPDILASTVDLSGVKLIPDMQVLKLLDSMHKAPDDVFTFSFDSLHIKGININDLLNASHIDLDSIIVSKPVIEYNHRPKKYNQHEFDEAPQQTLYNKLMGQLKSIKVKNIIIDKGTFISRQINNQTKTFNDVSVNLTDLLIDSTTQFDKQRLLFAKQFNISFANYLSRTSDSLYFFKVDSVNINATTRSLNAVKVSFVPRYNINEFEKKLQSRDDRFEIIFPKVTAQNIDWWSLTNNESFSCDEMNLYNGNFKDYFDRRLPVSVNKTPAKFPAQEVMNIPIKMNIKKINVHHMNISYEEYNPATGQTGSILFNDVNGSITNVSNIPSIAKNYKHIFVDAKCLFMEKVPLHASFTFDLLKYKTGNFTMQMNINEIDNTTINPVAESLGLFSFSSGTLNKADAKINAGQFSSTTNMTLLYNDLHLTPLKKGNNPDSNLKKKTITGFIANTFFIKNDNPSKGEKPRTVEVSVQHEPDQSFFNFIWKSLLTAILKTIGIPKKYANK